MEGKLGLKPSLLTRQTRTTRVEPRTTRVEPILRTTTNVGGLNTEAKD